MKRPLLLGHSLALLTILIWGSTFTSTKVLIGGGLDPVEIMAYRFVLAYAALWLAHPRFERPRSAADELRFLLAGASGVTMYFVFENSALAATTVSCVSLLVSSAPLMTMALAAVLWRERLTAAYAAGAVMAFAGVALVSGGNGQLYEWLGGGLDTLRGSLLALAAAASWALYSAAMRGLHERGYGGFVVTRRIFFYSLLTFPIPALLFKTEFHPALLLRPAMFLNTLFLGVVASALCYLTWNRALNELGPVRCNLYIYLNPLTALLTARIFLSEALGLTGWLGAALIVLGLIISNRPGVRPRGG